MKASGASYPLVKTVYVMIQRYRRLCVFRRFSEESMSNRRFELKLRSDSADPYDHYYPAQPRRGKKSSGTPRNFQEKLTTCSIICVCVLLAVMLLKIIDTNTTNSILKTFNNLLTSQTDFEKTADDVMTFVSETIAGITGKNVEVISPDTISIKQPLEEGTLVKRFESTVHPVFNTVIKPTGIEIKAKASAFVNSSCTGEVSNIVVNADDTKRIIVDYDKSVKVVYDNVFASYVKIGDKVAQGQVIGMMPEEESTLIFEVWVDNEAQDPIRYIGEVY